MTLIARDQACIWHPFTQHQTTTQPIPIVRGEGAYLIDAQGKRYLDAVSSWWVNLYGHCHPDIAKAIYEQAMSLEHVMFAGFTHEPAITLAENLLYLLPEGFTKVFYSDNGSTAVEVAIKMAYQYWHNQQETQRTRFLAFHNGYHGDTFGAMSVGKSAGFHSQFTELLFTVDMFAYPETWIGDELVEEKEQESLLQLTRYLEIHGSTAAALIIEPLVQGAGGMRMCRSEFLRKLECLVRSYGVLIIYDEVMTGFGRTGDFFACNVAGTSPDIICLAKGLTGGFLPLAVTACHERVYQAFLGENFTTAFAHGHSFTANPLGCAAALTALKLLQRADTQAQIKIIGNVHAEILSSLQGIHKPRYCGTIGAFDLQSAFEYGSTFSAQLREKFLEKGLIIRPLGKVIYFLPPYCITESELQYAYATVINELQGVIV